MTPIDNQPLTFQSSFETDSLCNQVNKKTYCQLYQLGDVVKSQWKMEACTDDLIVCDSPSVTLGSNLITNGTFDTDLSGWSANGYSWDTEKACATSLIGVGIRQDLSLTVGKKYRVTYTIVSIDGQINAILYDTNGIVRTTTGIFTEDIVAGSGSTIPGLHFGTLANSVCIDDVFVQEILSSCWDIYSFNGWTPIGDLLCHEEGYTDPLIHSSVAINVGGYYKVVLTISGSTQGTLTISLHDSTVVLSGNETFTKFITAGSTGNDFELIPSTDFDGCVTVPQVFGYPAKEDWEIGVFDLDGVWKTDIRNLSSTIHYDDDFVSLEWTFPVGGGGSAPYVEGCYRLCVIDGCEEYFRWSDYTLNQTLYSGNLVIDRSKLIFTADGSADAPFIESEPFSTHGSGCQQYTVTVQFGAVDPAFYGTNLVVDLYNASHNIVLGAGTVNSLVTFTMTVTGSPHSGSTFDITFDDSVGTGVSLEILYVKFKLKNQGCLFTYTDAEVFCSNCISVKASHACALMFDATSCNGDLGFNFTNFSLHTRLRVLFINPVSKNINSNYKLSNNTYFKYFAERDKIFELLFDYVDEITHDAIDAMLISDTLTINGIDYMWLEDAYKPEWDRNGTQSIAQSRIQIVRKDGHLTNSNCCD